ncbi:XamI family restriction endonuclease [Myxococcota bacterium]|nr:XamI family restriction endonuclease [Myxococcota bacterium]
MNKDRPHIWKTDVAASVDLYNAWFMKFAPLAFRLERVKTTKSVKHLFDITDALTKLTPAVLEANPGILPALRMSTCPPIARDRLIGLAGVNKNLVGCMESGRLPKQTPAWELNADLQRICEKLAQLLDTEMFPWLATRTLPDAVALDRTATILADRLCGAQADPIVRNAQEVRQLRRIEDWLEVRGYRKTDPYPASNHPNTMPPGTFAFRMSVRAKADLSLNIPIDVVVQPRQLRADRMPLLIEAKSAGDFTNVNKRRKEESDKMGHLIARFGRDVPFVLFLCGYFDAGYLGYEAAEGIDWVWEHRIDDFAELGL